MTSETLIDVKVKHFKRKSKFTVKPTGGGWMGVGDSMNTYLKLRVRYFETLTYSQTKQEVEY